jgi:hypothetical protein
MKDGMYQNCVWKMVYATIIWERWYVIKWYIREWCVKDGICQN